MNAFAVVMLALMIFLALLIGTGLEVWGIFYVVQHTDELREKEILEGLGIGLGIFGLVLLGGWYRFEETVFAWGRRLITTIET